MRPMRDSRSDTCSPQRPHDPPHIAHRPRRQIPTPRHTAPVTPAPQPRPTPLHQLPPTPPPPPRHRDPPPPLHHPTTHPPHPDPRSPQRPHEPPHIANHRRPSTTQPHN